MFQTFTDVVGAGKASERVAALRAEMAARGLDGFIVPHADEYQNEYQPACAQRLFWLTGFSGSAGMAIVLSGKAAIFADGRYTLQVRAQVDKAVFAPHHLTEQPPHDWLRANAPKDARIGYDPMLHTLKGEERLKAACVAAGAELVPVKSNPVDAVWHDRPAPPLGAVRPHPPEYAGEPASAKIARVQKELAGAGAAALVVTRPECVAWLFNIRGSDVAHTPLPLSRAIVPAVGRPDLFIDGAKLTKAVHDGLEGLVRVRGPAGLAEALAALAVLDGPVLLDPDGAGAWFAHRLKDAGGRILEKPDPIVAMKARKNDTEIDGARAAHLRDGAAVTRFLAWLDREAPSGSLDEIEAAKKLEEFRRGTGELQEISFDTISGAGPNGAIVHYRVTEATCRRLEPGTLYLVDSGGQYLDGTTDITRTIAIGAPGEEMRDRFTRVLKGHIAIATARFPEKTGGAHLDAFARRALWDAGLDFDHGTGHGVGSFLSVHEGPARISKVPSTALEPGMILSNEPGYYKSGQYGIRIENLLLVREPEAVPGGERDMLWFETLTLAPIDLRLVDPAMLDAAERGWLDGYHRRVRTVLAPMLDATDKAWLTQATRPLGPA